MRPVGLVEDNSYITVLSSETKPTVGVSNGAILLEVDTATWYVFYKGTWYSQ